MAYMNNAVKELFKNWPAGLKSDLVFKSASGRQMHSCNVSEAFTSVVNKLGLNDGVTDERQKIVFYTLRHTFASWLVIQGVAIYTVAELMGHSTVEMTKRYAHLSPATQRTAVMELDLIANGD
jgi:site-specific recombinase XerD